MPKLWKSWKRALARKRGVTLIEVTMAVAIFAVVIAVSAQSILSFYVAIDMQEDRIVATHAARAVLNGIREKRGEFRGSVDNALVDWTQFAAWVTAQNTANWTTFSQSSGYGALNSQAVRVTLLNVNGAPAVAADNPKQVHVTTTWLDAKGRTLRSTIVTRMTDR